MQSYIPPVPGYVRYRNREIGIVFRSQNKDMAEQFNGESIDEVNVGISCTGSVSAL